MAFPCRHVGVLVIGLAALLCAWGGQGGQGGQVSRRAELAKPARPVRLVRPARQADPLIAQRTKGAPKAPVTVYELSDFQCPYCRRQAMETLPILEREFITTGKVRWIFINFPLTQLHPNAVAASEFAMCAAKVDRFWPVHDLLFLHQKKWAPLKDPAPFLITLADSAGIPRGDLLPCLESREMQRLVQAEAEGAAKSGVQSTPTVYIEGAGLLPGAAPVAVFRQLLDSIWKERVKKAK